jgi:hypothetical protein
VSERYPTKEKYLIRIRSKRAGRVVEEVTGKFFNSIELDAIEADIWNHKFCLSDDFGLRVYRAIGYPSRWNRVNQIGFW